ncbi:MAG: hypothetical protein GY807_00985 [Gammaproteobacteria bacterium]|nr:hypothetical protein [Gammaproteobacteria bacterium]
MALSAKRPSKGKDLKTKLLQDVTETGGKTKRLNADIEQNLYRRIKARALEEDRSVSAITRQLWVEYLSK